MPLQTANGIQLHYTFHGQPVDGRHPRLLFLHGLGSSGEDWHKQIPAFAGDYCILTLDLRGHGRSQRPSGPYSIAQLATDVAALLNVLSFTPTHVVGLSLGGTVAMQLAADQPALVQSLTIVNSGPDLSPKTAADRRQARLRTWLIRLLGLKPFGRILGKKLFPDPINAADRTRFETALAGNTRGPYLAAFGAAMVCDLTPRLGEIRCPALVVSADLDSWPVAMKEAYVARMPNARLVVIADSHHALPVEKPVPFNAALRAFLDNQG